MATPKSAPVKRAPARRTTAATNGSRPKVRAEPGDPKFDWRQIYPQDVQLFKFTSDDGFVVCLPSYEDPTEGEVFGLMLMDKDEKDLLIYVMRQHITTNAIDAEGALLVTFQALKRMSHAGMVESLLRKWPEASGKELGKS